jgi:hypothetical protein
MEKKPAKTVAERQKEYRRRQRYGMQNLNLWIDAGAFKALQTLAAEAECSQREILENLLHAEQFKRTNARIEGLEAEKLLSNKNKDVTQ